MSAILVGLGGGGIGRGVTDANFLGPRSIGREGCLLLPACISCDAARFARDVFGLESALLNPRSFP